MKTANKTNKSQILTQPLLFNREAEQSVLGGLMGKNGSNEWEKVSAFITSESFYYVAHQNIWATLVELKELNSTIDPVPVGAKLAEKKLLDNLAVDDAPYRAGPYLGFLAANTAPSNIYPHAKIIFECWINRQAQPLTLDPIKNLDELTRLKDELQKISIYETRRDLVSNLLNEDLPDIEWLIDGLVTTESRSLLVSKPKVGKTRMLIDFALAVAHGGYALGKHKAAQGDVFFLALEGGKNRFKKMVVQTMQAQQITSTPGTFQYLCECPNVAEGGLQELEDWVNKVDNPRLIIIDTLKMFRPPPKKNAGVYDEDYGATQAVKKIVEKSGVAVLFAHHANKRGSSDPQELISGSFGLSGGLDNNLIISKQHGLKGAVLHRIGRDFDVDDDINIELTNEGYWREITEEEAISTERQEIIKVMRLKYTSTGEIAEVLGKTTAATSYLLKQMLVDGFVEKVGHGKYKLTFKCDLPPDDLSKPEYAPIPTAIAPKTLNELQAEAIANKDCQEIQKVVQEHNNSSFDSGQFDSKLLLTIVNLSKQDAQAAMQKLVDAQLAIMDGGIFKLI